MKGRERVFYGRSSAINFITARNEYISLFEKAHKNDKQFIEFIAERVKESEKEILRLLHIDIPKLI